MTVRQGMVRSAMPLRKIIVMRQQPHLTILDGRPPPRGAPRALTLFPACCFAPADGTLSPPGACTPGAAPRGGPEAGRGAFTWS
jgi:hypothetical protein